MARATNHNEISSSFNSNTCCNAVAKNHDTYMDELKGTIVKCMSELDVAREYLCIAYEKYIQTNIDFR